MRYTSHSSKFNNFFKWSVQEIKKILIVCTLLAVFVVLPFNYHSAKYQLNIQNETSKSFSNPGTVVAVINTAKMGTGGLSQNFINTWDCIDAVKVPTHLTYNCPNDRMVLRTHDVNVGAEVIKTHRQEHPEGQCLIVSVIRDPVAWLPSLYAQKKKICEAASMPKEEMLQDYKRFLAYLTVIDQSAESCLPRLINDFNGGSLIDQFKIMDQNGGYSILNAKHDSDFAGCKFLFLRMEQSDRWPDIIKMMVPENKFYRGQSQESLCSALSDHIQMLQRYELTKEEKMAIYSHGSPLVVDWFDSYGYMDMISDHSNEDIIGSGEEFHEKGLTNTGKVNSSVKKRSYNSPETVIAVISTPKTGTGGLSQNFIRTWNCKNAIEDAYHLTYDCPNDQLVVRAHNYEAGAHAIQQHREKHPEGRCLIVSSIRDPGAWLPSLYIQKKRICENVTITKEEMFSDYKRFLSESDLIWKSALSCLPGLIREFNGRSLTEQLRMMDQNGGYTLLSAKSESALVGCELLLLKLEQSEQWPGIIKTVVPENNFFRGATRSSQCPEIADHIKMIQDYELTSEEKMSIKTRGGGIMADWFDAYEYI